MWQTLFSLGIVLTILATGTIADSIPDLPIRTTGLQEIQAFAQPSPDRTVSDRETEEFRKLLVDYYAAWSVPIDKPWDISKAERFYQRSDRMFGFDFNPPAEGFQGWEAYKRELTKIMSNYDKFTVILGDRFSVYRNGNVVWTISTFNFTGTLKNSSPIDGSGRNTLVWERVGDRWLIAHEHVSTPLVPQAK